MILIRPIQTIALNVLIFGRFSTLFARSQDDLTLLENDIKHFIIRVRQGQLWHRVLFRKFEVIHADDLDLVLRRLRGIENLLVVGLIAR